MQTGRTIEARESVALAGPGDARVIIGAEALTAAGYDPAVFHAVVPSEGMRGGRLNKNDRIYGPPADVAAHHMALVERAREGYVGGWKGHSLPNDEADCPVDAIKLLDGDVIAEEDGSVTTRCLVGILKTSRGDDVNVMWRAGKPTGLSLFGICSATEHTIDAKSPYAAMNPGAVGKRVELRKLRALEKYDVVFDPSFGTFFSDPIGVAATESVVAPTDSAEIRASAERLRASGNVIERTNMKIKATESAAIAAACRACIASCEACIAALKGMADPISVACVAACVLCIDACNACIMAGADPGAPETIACSAVCHKCWLACAAMPAMPACVTCAASCEACHVICGHVPADESTHSTSRAHGAQETTMEIKDIKALESAYPELVRQLREETAAKAATEATANVNAQVAAHQERTAALEATNTALDARLKATESALATVRSDLARKEVVAEIRTAMESWSKGKPGASVIADQVNAQAAAGSFQTAEESTTAADAAFKLAEAFAIARGAQPDASVADRAGVAGTAPATEGTQNRKTVSALSLLAS